MNGQTVGGIYYEVAGNGPWMTLSHSLACNLQMWDPQMELLTKHFKVLRFDTRGHGKSVVSSAPYTLDQLAKDASDLFQELGVQQTHWIGLSRGGMIGQTLALLQPNLFASLVLADTTSRRPDNAVQMWGERIDIVRAQGMEGLVDSTLSRWFTAPYKEKNSPAMQAVTAQIRSTPVEGFAGCAQAISAINTFDRLPEITCRTLIVVGSDDHGTPPAMAQKIHEQIQGSVYHVIPEASHISNVEQTDLFNQHLCDFYKIS